MMVCQLGLVYFILTARIVSAQVLKYALKGQDITLVPDLSEKPDAIIWVHDGINVVEFNVMQERPYVYPTYEKRTFLDQNTAELTIKNAKYEDSGNYDLKLKTDNKYDRLKYTIEVIDKVTKPNISCEMINISQAMLVCTTECKCPHLLKFKWRSQGKEQTGPNLNITLSNDHDDQVYQCDVSNPLSKEIATFSAKDCFPGETYLARIFIRPDIMPILTTAVLILVTGFIFGYMFRRKYRCSVCLQKIRKRISSRRQRTLAKVPDIAKCGNDFAQQGSEEALMSGKNEGKGGSFVFKARPSPSRRNQTKKEPGKKHYQIREMEGTALQK
ncbi:lymphocyte function-associated antigen 3-like [Vanacampus margaritifer]